MVKRKCINKKKSSSDKKKEVPVAVATGTSLTKQLICHYE